MTTNTGGLASALTQARNENTPAAMKRIQMINWVIVAVFTILNLVCYGDYRYVTQTIGRDAAPSVFAAHEIKNNVYAMDRAAANYLAARPGENMAALREFDQVRPQLAAQLVAAAKKISFGEEEEQTIRRLNQGLSRYDMAFQAAKDLHEANDPAYMAKYREAYRVLTTDIVESADMLDKINSRALASAHQAVGNTVVFFAFAVVSGVALIGWSIWSQVYLRRRFSRKFSGPLLTSIVVAGLFVAFITTAFLSHNRYLYIAKTEAYESIIDLMNARASAYDQNAALSRYLLDRPLADKHQKVADTRAKEVGDLNGRSTFDAEADVVKSGRKSQFLTGSLGRATDSLSFEGEREAAAEAVRTWGAYSRIDLQVRAYQAAFMHAEAIQLAIGTEKGQAVWAFKQFDHALNQTIVINREAFTAYVNSANSSIAFIWELSIAQALVQIGLFFMAFRPRMREFHV